MDGFQVVLEEKVWRTEVSETVGVFLVIAKNQAKSKAKELTKKRETKSDSEDEV